MTRAFFALAVAVAFVLGILASRVTPPAQATSINPSTGFNIHVDALKHFGTGHPNEVAHHWCKAGLSNGLIECLIFDSDSPTARVVEVETIVAPAVYKSFSASEQAMWHWHMKEIPIVKATLPDMNAKQAAAFVKQISPTYGKIWMLWDPMAHQQPTGVPQVVILPKH